MGILLMFNIFQSHEYFNPKIGDNFLIIKHFKFNMSNVLRGMNAFVTSFIKHISAAVWTIKISD